METNLEARNLSGHALSEVTYLEWWSMMVLLCVHQFWQGLQHHWMKCMMDGSTERPDAFLRSRVRSLLYFHLIVLLLQTSYLMPVKMCYFWHFFVYSAKEIWTNYVQAASNKDTIYLIGCLLNCLLCVETMLLHPFKLQKRLFMHTWQEKNENVWRKGAKLLDFMVSLDNMLL